MKRIIIFSIVALFPVSMLSAQDLITTNEGKDIEAKILEVNPDNIKFKKFNNLEGPTFTMLKSDILIVRYENGESDVFASNHQRLRKSNNILDPSNGVTERMTFREYKHFYDARDYVPDFNDPYNRGLAGLASAWLPGLGQVLDGEYLRGIGFFGATVGCFAIGCDLVGYGCVSEYDDNGYCGDSFFNVAGCFFMAAAMTFYVWNICDAVRISNPDSAYS